MGFSRPQGPFMVHYECFGLGKGLAWVKSVHIFPIHVVLPPAWVPMLVGER